MPEMNNRVRHHGVPAQSISVKDHATALLTRAAKPSLDGGIEALRASVASAEDTTSSYNRTQLQSVVESISLGRPLREVGRESGLGPEAVVTAVIDIGTWLTHVLGSAEVPFVAPGTLQQPALFAVAAPPKGKKKATQAPAKKAGKSAKAQRPVEIPAGFEPAALGKDITASLGAVIATAPQSDLLDRFWARNHRRTSDKALTFEVVAGVAFFARLGRLGDLGLVNDKSVGFKRLALQAHDLLEVGRRDALAGMAVLVSDETDIDVITAAVAKAAVMWETEMERLARLVAASAVNEASVRMLDRERRFLRQRVLNYPGAYLLGSIAELRDGQVLRIAQAAGLAVERDKATELEARRLLARAGLTVDADVYLTEAIEAVREGHTEQFCATYGRAVLSA
jgi:hypothetical protein